MMSIASSIWNQYGCPNAFKRVWIYYIYILYRHNVHGLAFCYQKDFRLLQVSLFGLTL
jgi:hypothetical protein